MKWTPGPPLFLRACRIHLDRGSHSPCGRGVEGTSPRRTTIRGTMRLERMPLQDKSLKPSGSATVRDDSAMPSLRFITTLLQLHCALLCLLLRLRACKPRNSADTRNDIQSNKGRTGASGAGEEASSSGSRLNRSAPLTACSEGSLEAGPSQRRIHCSRGTKVAAHYHHFLGIETTDERRGPPA